MALRFLIAAYLLLFAASSAWAASLADERWPAPSVQGSSGVEIKFPSHTPFALEDVGEGPELNPPREVHGRLFLPDGASAANKAAAVIMLHGSAGLLGAREYTYGPQYAAMGVAAVAIDSFGSRRDIATAYIDRVINITETAMVNDAYAALRYLAARPEIDARRVAVMGYSYGALAALLAAYAMPAERFAPDGLRFAAHVSYYGPCLARFADRRMTGAPILLLAAENDAVTDPTRCVDVMADIRAGGAQVDLIRYPGAFHQWDGNAGRPDAPVRRANNLAPCRFEVERDATIRDLHSGLAMRNTFFRKLIFFLCRDSDGYLQARDDTVREKSNRDVGRFLTAAFAAAIRMR
jgi:dienelactone hydrolase